MRFEHWVCQSLQEKCSSFWLDGEKKSAHDGLHDEHIKAHWCQSPAAHIFVSTIFCSTTIC